MYILVRACAGCKEKKKKVSELPEIRLCRLLRRTVSGGCMAMQTQTPETELAARNVQKLSAAIPAEETR